MAQRRRSRDAPFFRWMRLAAALYVRETFELCDHNGRRTARLLGVSRYTVARHLEDYEVEFTRREEKEAHQEQAPSPAGAPKRPGPGR